MIKKENSISIEYHADDYGMFPLQSQRILHCHTSGLLNGVSIMPNSPYLSECIEMLRPYQADLLITIHLNLIEGTSVCDPSDVPLLTDQNGFLRVNFESLLLKSYLPGRSEWKAQLKKELRSQIQAVQSLLPGVPLRLDSHAHYHMIPVVFDSLMEVIQEEKLNVSYIRIPREELSIYIKNLFKLRGVAPINLVKVAILQILSLRNEKIHRHAMASFEKKLFMGVFLSGCMFRENLEHVLPDLIKLGKQKNCALEVLAHPGGVYEPDDLSQLSCREDVIFLSNPNRNKEMEMLMRQ